MAKRIIEVKYLINVGQVVLAACKIPSVKLQHVEISVSALANILNNAPQLPITVVADVHFDENSRIKISNAEPIN